MQSWTLVATCLALVLTTCSCASADWTERANQSIETIRKGDAAVRVVDIDGNPVEGASVEVELAEHEFWFGTALNYSMFRPKAAGSDDAVRYKKIARELFNSAVHENAAKWYHTQRGGKDPDFADADRVLEWATASGLRMRGHCIFWGRPKYVPDWQKELPDEALRKAVLARAERVTRHFRGKIDEWDLANEMLDTSVYEQRLGKNIVLDMARAAEKGNPDVKLYVNDYGILGGGRLERYVKQIRELLGRGVPIDGIGCQGHFNPESPDPATVKRALDALAEFDLPIRITEFDCRHGENHEARADGLEVVYRVAFAHPKVTGILMWGFWARRHWQPPAALYGPDWNLRPQGKRYKALMAEWHTEESGTTGADGRFGFRGFYGKYDVKVTGPDGKTATARLALSKDGGRATTVTLR